jgi:predicted dehydrogenase
MLRRGLSASKVIKPVRWGVLGCARVFQKRMLPAFAASEHNTLTALASRDFEKARSVADANGIPHAFGDYDALLAAPDIDAVYIPLPNDIHAEYTERALLAGKHVLCDKPFTLISADAKRCAALADERGLRLMEGFMYRHHPQHMFVQGLLLRGDIGVLTRIDTTFCYTATIEHAGIRWNPTQGGGALWDVGVYGINLARMYMGEPQSVYSRLAMHAETGVDIHNTVVLDYADGRHAILHSGFDQAFSSTATLTGTLGSITLERAFQVGEAGTRVRYRSHGTDDVQTMEFPYINQWQRELDDFALSVRIPETPLVGGENGVAQSVVMDAVIRSAQSGRREEI